MLAVIMLHSDLSQGGCQGVLQWERQMGLSLHGIDERIAQALRTPAGKAVGEDGSPGRFSE